MDLFITPLPRLAATARVGLLLEKQRDSNPQLHLGLIYARKNEPAQHLHLAFHADLQCAIFRPSEYGVYFGASLRVEPEQVDLIIAAADEVVRSNPDGFPYGILFTDGTALKEGLLDLGTDGGHGLTCATFILALLQAVGISLVHTSSWEARPEDEKWHASIVRALERLRREDSSKVSPDHIANVRAETGCARFRPEEIMAAATSDAFPMEFEACRMRGALVRARIERPTHV